MKAEEVKRKEVVANVDESYKNDPVNDFKEIEIIPT
jgi:hypothetical protein